MPLATTVFPSMGHTHVGHIYLVTAKPVNVVGSGVNTSGTCTPATRTAIR